MLLKLKSNCLGGIMSNQKQFLAFGGIILILLGIIIYGFIDSISELIHDKDVNIVNVVITDANQESIYHPGSRGASGYYTYDVTLKFKVDGEEQVCYETSRTRNLYMRDIGSTVLMYQYKDSFKIEREHLFQNPILRDIGIGFAVVGIICIVYSFKLEE